MGQLRKRTHLIQDASTCKQTIGQLSPCVGPYMLISYKSYTVEHLEDFKVKTIKQMVLWFYSQTLPFHCDFLYPVRCLGIYGAHCSHILHHGCFSSEGRDPGSTLPELHAAPRQPRGKPLLPQHWLLSVAFFVQMTRRGSVKQPPPTVWLNGA